MFSKIDITTKRKIADTICNYIVKENIEHGEGEIAKHALARIQSELLDLVDEIVEIIKVNLDDDYDNCWNCGGNFCCDICCTTKKE